MTVENGDRLGQRQRYRRSRRVASKVLKLDRCRYHALIPNVLLGGATVEPTWFRGYLNTGPLPTRKVPQSGLDVKVAVARFTGCKTKSVKLYF